MVFIHPLCHLGTPMEVSNPKGCGGVMSHSCVMSGSPLEIFRVTCGVGEEKEGENKGESCPSTVFGFVLAVIPSIRCSLNSPLSVEGAVFGATLHVPIGDVRAYCDSLWKDTSFPSLSGGRLSRRERFGGD